MPEPSLQKLFLTFIAPNLQNWVSKRKKGHEEHKLPRGRNQSVEKHTIPSQAGQAAQQKCCKFQGFSLNLFGQEFSG